MARSSDSPFLLGLLKDKTFQAREIRRVIGLSLVYLAVTTVLVGVFYHQMLGRLIEGMAPLLFVSEDMDLVNEAVAPLSAVLGKWLIAMLIVNAIITVGVGMFITRRLGQPILAIKRSLREIGNGNLDVRLRDSDSRDFGEIANELTAAMHSVRKQISAAKAGIEQISDLDESANEDERNALNECRAALDFFQVEIDLDQQDDPAKAA
ncbi:MAG: methyl-accepting chemotaxis protein [Granulosicoccus sp.]